MLDKFCSICSDLFLHGVKNPWNSGIVPLKRMGRGGMDWSGLVSRCFDPPVFVSMMSCNSHNLPCSTTPCLPKAANVVTAFRLPAGFHAVLVGSQVSWEEPAGVLIVHCILHLSLEDFLRVLLNLSFHWLFVLR